MKIDTTLAAKGGEAKETRAEKAIRLLTTTAGSPFKHKLGEFSPFYPAVVTAKRNGFKNKQIIKILAEAGLKLYPALLGRLMAAMEDDRDLDTCPHCGQAIQAHVNRMENVSTLADRSLQEGA